jgi:hypothetical protein
VGGWTFSGGAMRMVVTFGRYRRLGMVEGKIPEGMEGRITMSAFGRASLLHHGPFGGVWAPGRDHR